MRDEEGVEDTGDNGSAWQSPPAIVLSIIVKHLNDVRDRAAVSSVCRFWRLLTFYWIDVYELTLNHADLDNDYFKFALNGSDHVQMIPKKRLSVKNELPLCLRCFFERFTVVKKVRLVACDVRTPLIKSLKYFSRKLHSLIITDDHENTAFDPLPDPLALYNKAVLECLQHVQANWEVLPSSCIITVDYMRMWLGRIRLILTILPRSVRYLRLFNSRYAEMSITQKEREAERMKGILSAVPTYQRLIVDIVGEVVDEFGRNPIIGVAKNM